MLQVGVHHGDISRGTRQDSFDAGGSKPATTNPLNASYSPIKTGNSAHGLRRTILRVVIDEDRFPVDAAQRAAQRVINGTDVVMFVSGRHDDGKLGPRYSRAPTCPNDRCKEPRFIDGRHNARTP